jgi:hypothetical protein
VGGVTDSGSGGGQSATEAESAAYASIDARTGPFLAAIAFFMTGGVAALSNGNIRNARFLFPNGASVPLPLIAIACSLLLAGLAAMSLVLSLGPPEPPPIRAKSAAPSKVADVLPVQVRHSWYKYERIVEARAFFLLALPFFLLGILATLFVLSGEKTFGWPLASTGGLIVLVVTFVAGNDRARIESLGGDVKRDSRLFTILAGCLAVSSLLYFLAAGWGGLAVPGSLAVLAFAMTLLACYHLRARQKSIAVAAHDKRALDGFRPAFLILIQLPALVVAWIPAARPLVLVFALAPIGIFEGSRLVYGYAGITKRDHWKAINP